jgi:hypothetical protein
MHEPSPEFLAAARDEGQLLYHAGERFVAGPFDDPVAGRSYCYIPYAAPALRADPALLQVVLDRATDHCGQLDVLIRMPCDDLPRPDFLTPYVRYLRLGPSEAGAGGAESENTVRVRDAGPNGADRRFVVAMLSEAFARAYSSFGHPPADAAVRRQVQLLLDGGDGDSPACSLLAVTGPAGANDTETIVGHLTWQATVDDVTGQVYREIVDTDVLARSRGSGVTGALLRAFVGQFRDAVPALGHVVAGPPAAVRVYRQLVTNGWIPDHDYLRRTA